MPAIFNENNKEAIRSKMLENGFALIKQYGLKKTTIQDIAKATGLAKGTFYTFFPSKEEFVFQIMEHNREKVRLLYNQLTTESGTLTRQQTSEFLQGMHGEDTNIYAYLTDEDINWLHARWPQDHVKDENVDEETTKWLLSGMEDVRPECDWRVVANCMKTMALMEMNKELLHQNAYKDTLTLYRESLLDYIFSAEQSSRRR